MSVEELYEKAFQDAIEHPENYKDIFDGYENDFPKALALIEWQKQEFEHLTVNMNAFGLAAKRLAEERREVARILRELEKSVALKIPMEFRPIFKDDRNFEDGFRDGKHDALIEVLVLIAELKKKYTEEVDSK